jgi:hypothetical protein
MKPTTRCLALSGLLPLCSCITSGLWSTDQKLDIQHVQPVEVRRTADADRWWLRLPTPSPAGSEWLLVVPAKDQAALAEVARLAEEATAVRLASLTVDSTPDSAEPWSKLLDGGPGKSLGLRVVLPQQGVAELRPCAGLRVEMDTGDLHVSAASDCVVARADGPDPGAVPLAAAMHPDVSVWGLRRYEYRFGAVERILMTPVTVVVDVIALPLLPVAGAFMLVAGRYIRS